MMGRFIGFTHLVARLAGIDLNALLDAEGQSVERIEALDRLHRLFHSRLMQLVTRTPALLFSLGIPPRQRALLGGAPVQGAVLFGGPFVMDTPERLAQTKRDFASGKMGRLDGVPF